MDNTKKQSQRFIRIFAIASLLMLSAIALFIYIIDPFFQYRITDNRYILNPIYNNTGLAMNADYNTVIIGSSMTQNYDLSILRKDSVTKPVKLASGAITLKESKLLFNLTNKEKTNTFIINLDMIQFNEWLTPYRYPEYLHEGGFLNRLKYHFAYESTVRYGLTDLVLTPYMLLTDEEELPEKVKIRTKVDDIGNFSLDATYNDAERIKRMYRSGQTVTLPQIPQMNARMKMSTDDYLKSLEFDKYPDKEYIIVFPPYSVLYWYITKRDNYYHAFIQNIKFLCRSTKDNKNVRIQFFYNLDQISDLSRYSDVTHFDPATSNYILENLRNEDYTINTENMNEWLNRLDSTVNKFAKDNVDWL